MCSIRLINISQKVSYQLTPENAKLSHEDCLVANSRSTGPQQRNTDDHSCPVDTAERSSSADWRTADVDD